MSKTKAHVTICQPLSSSMTDEAIRRHASETAREYPDGTVAVIWADGTHEEFSRPIGGGAPRVFEATELTSSCLPASEVLS